MQDKKVSIIMNCYNGQDFLKESINSVIDQTYKKWELIFYDNCSTDKSAQIVKKYNDKRIKYYRSKKNLKLGLARKKALSKPTKILAWPVLNFCFSINLITSSGKVKILRELET